MSDAMSFFLMMILIGTLILAICAYGIVRWLVEKIMDDYFL